MDTRRLLPLALAVVGLFGMKGVADWLRHLVPRGTLVAHEPEFTLRLRFGPRSPRRRIVIGRRGQATLAARTYLLEGWSARMPDAQGRTWEIERAPGEPARVVTVLPDRETRLPLAAPIEPELVIDQLGGEVGFRLRLKGAGGETLAPARVDGRPLPPPILRIEDAHGRVGARLRFDDTCGAGCAQSWRPPPGLAQPFRAVPELDLGPFAVKAAAFRFRLATPAGSLPTAATDSGSR